VNEPKQLIKHATGPRYFWSRVPGKFVSKTTGAEYSGKIDFNGTVREWYETLVETLIDVSFGLERNIPASLKCEECGTKKYAVNACVVSPDIQTILECSVLYKPSFALQAETSPFGTCATCGKVNVPLVGSLANRFDIYVDQRLRRDQALVGSVADGKFVEDTAYVGVVTVLDMAGGEAE